MLDAVEWGRTAPGSNQWEPSRVSLLGPRQEKKKNLMRCKWLDPEDPCLVYVTGGRCIGDC